MEGRKKVGSASSITNELFGSKESSSSGIFGAIFAPPSKVLGRESLRSDSMEKKQDNSKESWNTKPGAPGDASKAHQSIMVAKTSMLNLRIPRALELTMGIKKTGEKMIPGVLQEEIGGKDLSIIKGSLAEEYILVKVHRKIE
ncbi:hypothetical protein Q3G72_024887 [Acer saccharum]|nr:hypothetical protein Q3G72_024887 [Acer saccharum]